MVKYYDWGAISDSNGTSKYALPNMERVLSGSNPPLCILLFTYCWMSCQTCYLNVSGRYFCLFSCQDGESLLGAIYGANTPPPLSLLLTDKVWFFFHFSAEDVIPRQCFEQLPESLSLFVEPEYVLCIRIKLCQTMGSFWAKIFRQHIFLFSKFSNFVFF